MLTSMPAVPPKTKWPASAKAISGLNWPDKLKNYKSKKVQDYIGTIKKFTIELILMQTVYDFFLVLFSRNV